MRVMSDGAPNWLTSRAEKSVTRWNSSLRTSRPKLMATRALTYTAPTENATCTSVTPSMAMPTDRM
jgi:hypothetical protein